MSLAISETELSHLSLGEPMRLNDRSARRQTSGPRTAVASRVAHAIDSGDLDLAYRLLEAEAKRSPENTAVRLHLAVMKQVVGDRDGAAGELTRVLRLAPGNAAAAQRLAAILQGGRLGSAASLDPAGLVACLQHRTIDRDLVGAAAVDQMSRNGSLRKPLEALSQSGTDEAAASILSRRSAPLLRDELLLAVLRYCVIASAPLERLLTSIRRHLLVNVSLARLAEPDLARFSAALATLCWSNEYVFAETHDETRRVTALSPSLASAIEGDPVAGATLLLHCLYRDPLAVMPADITADDVTKVSPSVFARVLAEMISEKRMIRERGNAIRQLGIIQNDTSLKVKAQYEAHPYPRWRSVSVYPDGRYLEYLETYFSREELAFVQTPFDILIAGCGTGMQAVSAALDYGAAARVTGLDISAASLGYASLMAERMKAGNLTLALGDINDIGSLEPSWHRRFRVIECTGVLHHMADPFEAWRGLLDCLAPGGIMLVGLYSAIARRELETLRREPMFPGAGCSDTALRRYREALLQRGPEAAGASFLGSRDTFTTSGFRDFFLHVSEKTTTLAEIQAFLAANGLVFRGFVTAPFGALQWRFPGEVWPGRLERWAELEAERPKLFIGMYQFWVSRQS